MNKNPRELGKSGSEGLSISNSGAEMQKHPDTIDIQEFNDGRELPLGVYNLSIINEPKDGQSDQSETGEVVTQVRVFSKGWRGQDMLCYALGSKLGTYAPNRIDHIPKIRNLEYQPLEKTDILPPEFGSGKVQIVFTNPDQGVRAQQTAALNKPMRPGEYTFGGSYDALFSPEKRYDAAPTAKKQIFSMPIAKIIHVDIKGVTLRDLCFTAAGMSEGGHYHMRDLVGDIRIDNIRFTKAAESKDVSGDSLSSKNDAKKLEGKGLPELE